MNLIYIRDNLNRKQYSTVRLDCLLIYVFSLQHGNDQVYAHFSFPILILEELAPRWWQVRKVEDDLDLLVNNALAFNRQSDPVYQQALELQSVYRAELPHLKNILEREQARAKRGSDADGQLDKKARMR